MQGRKGAKVRQIKTMLSLNESYEGLGSLISAIQSPWGAFFREVA